MIQTIQIGGPRELIPERWPLPNYRVFQMSNQGERNVLSKNLNMLLLLLLSRFSRVQLCATP